MVQYLFTQPLEYPGFDPDSIIALKLFWDFMNLQFSRSFGNFLQISQYRGVDKNMAIGSVTMPKNKRILSMVLINVYDEVSFIDIRFLDDLDDLFLPKAISP